MCPFLTCLLHMLKKAVDGVGSSDPSFPKLAGEGLNKQYALYISPNRTTEDLGWPHIQYTEDPCAQNIYYKQLKNYLEGFCVIYSNIYNKYHFSDFTLLSTKDKSYHFSKTLQHRQRHPDVYYLQNSGGDSPQYKTWAFSVGDFSDQRWLENAGLSIYILLCWSFCVFTGTHVKAPGELDNVLLKLIPFRIFFSWNTH